MCARTQQECTLVCYVLLICLLTRPELQVEAEMIGYVEQKHRRVGSDVTA